MQKPNFQSHFIFWYLSRYIYIYIYTLLILKDTCCHTPITVKIIVSLDFFQRTQNHSFQNKFLLLLPKSQLQQQISGQEFRDSRCNHIFTFFNIKYTHNFTQTLCCYFSSLNHLIFLILHVEESSIYLSSAITQKCQYNQKESVFPVEPDS